MAYTLAWDVKARLSPLSVVKLRRVTAFHRSAPCQITGDIHAATYPLQERLNIERQSASLVG